MPIRRSILAILVAALAAVPALAQVAPPPLITNQGLLRDRTTGLPYTGNVDLLFVFYPGPSSLGNDILSDAHAGVAVSAGQFSVQLGGGLVADGAGPGSYTALPEVFRDFAPWMEIRVTSPFVETLLPRVRVLSAPYAMTTTYAGDSGALGGRASSSFLDVSASSQTKSGGLTLGSLSTTGSLTANGGLTAPLLSIAGPVTAGGGIAFPDGAARLSARTPAQIGTLRYDTPAGNDFPVGGQPLSIAFDGAYIWVGSNTAGNVKKLSAADGQTLGTFPVASPFGIAVDGANVWVTNNNSGTVSKLRASDGANLGSFPIGNSGGPGPYAICYDGSSVWVTQEFEDNVTRLRVPDGANLGVFPVGSFPIGIACDGTNVWVTNYAGNTVTRLRGSDGANIGTFVTGAAPFGVAFDGSSVWIANEHSNTVTRLRASDGAILGTYAVGDYPIGVVFDGSSIWATNLLGDSVTRLRATDGTSLGTFPTGSGPVGAAFDGSSLWVTSSNTDTVRKM